jgi:transcription-repair coupling factor (superfamily II helicase)
VSVRLEFLEFNSAVGEAEDVKRETCGVNPKAPHPSRFTPHVSRFTSHASLPPAYVPEPQQRIEIYRKLAQAADKPALDALQAELRDRFGPLPPAVELLLQAAELKILAGDRAVTVIEVKEDKLMLTRHGDFVTLGGKFPRLTKQQAGARLKEIKKLLLAL